MFNYFGTVFQAGAFSPVVGSLVWLEDPDVAWMDGEVVEVNGEEVKVLCTSGKMVGALYTGFFWKIFVVCGHSNKFCFLAHCLFVYLILVML